MATAPTIPAPLELERFLPYRLSVLSNTISAAIARDYGERFGLAVTEWRVLVSRAVNSLLKSGRIKRDTHADDRRRSVLTLSAKGRKVYDEVAPTALRYERELLSVLDREERAWLERILGKLIDEGHDALARAAAPQR
jgi:hypothetical protein